MMPELAQWDNFYVIVGSAAGALIGLQFVVLTLINDKPPEGVEEAGPAFGSPTIVHFSYPLFLSALLHAPWQSIAVVAALWGISGFAGLFYCVLVVRRMVKQGAYKPVSEDWLFHALLPVAAYAALVCSAFTACAHTRGALFAVGGAALLLLFIGIHNSWDNIAYHVIVNIAGKGKK